MSVPAEAHAVRLYHIVNDSLRPCIAIAFAGGSASIDTVLRRAGVSGHIEIAGKIGDHFADILDIDVNILETVALDAKSYGALKNRWMRTALEIA